MEATISKEEIKLSSLEINGEYVFVYSDKYNIFFFILEQDDNSLYKVTTDKSLTLETVDLIDLPEEYIKKLNFFKPQQVNNTDYVFSGIVSMVDESYKFTIGLDNELVLVEKANYVPAPVIGVLQSLKSAKVFSSIQRREKLYVTGYDSEYKDYFYGIVNTESDSFERVYSLCSDMADIVPLTINLDTEERKVYVGGYIETGELDTPIKKPFLECFMLM